MARAAEVEDVVTRVFSGHATETMQQHYSTVAPSEIREAIGKVISLAGIRKAAAAVGEKANQGGVHEAEKKKAN